MRIVISTAVYYPQINGVAVFSHNLACGLVRRGHEVLVICPSQTGKSYSKIEDGVKVCYLKSVDVKVYPDQIHVANKKRRFFYRHGLRVSVFPGQEVGRVLDGFMPDVVHVQVSDPIGLSVAAWARRAGVPVVTTEHNQPEVLTGSLKMPRAMRRSANALLYMYFRNRQNKSDFVTMPTEQAIRNLLSRGEIGVPIAAVSNGVNIARFKPGRATAEIYEKYKLKQNVPIVLYVGRVDPEKKVKMVIKAFKKARGEVPGAELVIVGDGVEKAKLERAYGIKDGVRFLGKVMPPDLYELYKVGNVFVTASEIETQGIVLIEAAATGLPLIAVQAGAVAEVCRNEVNGYLCKPGAMNEMAKAMVKILSDSKLQKKFGVASVRIAAEHDFEKTLDKFINIYGKLVKS